MHARTHACLHTCTHALYLSIDLGALPPRPPLRSKIGCSVCEAVPAVAPACTRNTARSAIGSSGSVRQQLRLLLLLRRRGRGVPGSLGEEGHLLAPLAQLAALRHAAAATRGAAAPPRGPQKVEQRRQQQPATVGTQPVTACMYPRGPEKIVGSAGRPVRPPKRALRREFCCLPSQRWSQGMVAVDRRQGRAYGQPRSPGPTLFALRWHSSMTTST